MNRIEELRKYMFEVLDSILSNKQYKINANFLDSDIDNYSLNKIPMEQEITKWIIGGGINQDTYEFISRKGYSADVDNNLKNIGFYEAFEKKIKINNDKKILPNIEGIHSIECLNCGSLTRADTKTCVFGIQIRITYEEEV